MARPIEPTPVLEGEDAIEFLKRMNQPPSKEQIKMFERMKKAKKIF
ncbi:MAG: hypothetical protein Q4P18_06995 [Methanobrevibacter sp.]|nr:hypothetical protein [Methanobrevibacter sp.]MDO5849263.1 hypothetical protein [Methanobrevibacter sp.]